ncbi:[LSU ribosomal protein L11P]-lysine N-methyltransferase [Nitrosomonas sp. PY1]|uniref:50S ribosomal protein L11 methyltransferase n=1 Tax=Nitrosomonas sp. PY1 TaxID=1803906 RepID=UPI001FC7CA98|nr:50S ribosomal protein L11 methyltransferase [Nitrosomonas sp. PY1]GKS68616.1 [LSU ribosomal protein L11P]-lysine N-methyltransferase [Nitrosomonas sp. PY1]
MPWIALIFRTDADHAELLSDALMEQGAISVDIHDAAADSRDEQPLFGEPGNTSEEIWQNAEISALFDGKADADIARIVGNLVQLNCLSEPVSYRVEQVEEQDWVRLTQSQFTPIQISSRMWIVPTWHTPPDPTAINLLLDPGLAFGSGSHPTTQLCLCWLEQNLKTGETLIDYGCGSGILAIGALKLGACHVTGIDIDPQAITVSHDNAIRNQCNPSQFVFSISHSSREPVDIVIANILTNPLTVLAPLLISLVKRGGNIVLSGILCEQADQVIQAYQPWFDMKLARQQEDWVLLVGRKR